MSRVITMPTIELYPHTCPRCKKTFEYPRKPVPGMYFPCRDCTQIIIEMNIMERKLLKQKSFIEQEDAVIAKKMREILAKTKIDAPEKEIIKELTARLTADKARQKKIIAEINALETAKK